MKKRFLSLILALMMVLSLAAPGTAALADETVTADVYVSIADKGSVELSYAAVTAKDLDGDGAINIDEALAAAHEKYYESGSEGYATATGDYGLYITKLWGDESGNFGYWVDNAMAWGLTDTLKDGQHLYAYIAANAYPNTDAYAYFTASELSACEQSPVSATLNYQSGYDDSWNPVFSGYEGAALKAYTEDLSAEAEGFSYEALGNGEYNLSFENAGSYCVVATAEGNAIVPAVCRVTVVDTAWKNFRNSDVNMAISSAETPTNAELKWVFSPGTDWKDSPSAQIIADGCLVFTSNSTLYKLSLTDGSVTAKAEMAAAHSYGSISPVCADGLIIVGLDGGVLQAFDAKTLEAKWTYTDAIGGQALTPMYCSDGRLYTGFWNSETAEANFVCVDISTGALEWSYASAGGFYGAGAVAVGDFIVVGTDDGASGSTGAGSLLSFKKSYAEGETVSPVSSVKLDGCGDVRSTLAYDGGTVYFTTKGGYLCSAAVDEGSGEITNLKTSSLNAQSTSTPVVYGDKLYFGAGSGVTSSGSKGYFVVADKESLEVVTSVELAGYPQCSFLLSTAYLDETGELYFYGTFNAAPGGIILIKVSSDCSKLELSTLYDAEGYEQYCAASVICGEDGSLYYKNDSGNIFCVGEKAVTENVYVSIADKGSLVVDYAEITATDLNGDGAVDIDEALTAAHDEYYEGGAAAGYASANSQWGLSITRLWGDESGNFGYWVDNAMAWGLSDTLSDGQHLYAYIAANAYPNTDAYAYFAESVYEMFEGTEVKASVNYQSGYDDSWNPVFSDYNEATLKAYASDGSEVEDFTYSSLSDGGYALSFPEAGIYRVVASSDSNAIIPAACTVIVKFTDIEAGWYYDAVKWGYTEGITDGTGLTTFEPMNICTRAEVVTFLYRAAGSPEVSGDSGFNDVAEGSWYYDAVLWAEQNGIAEGTGGGSFTPLRQCTRAEIITFLYRAAGSPAVSGDSGFNDVAEGSWYYNAVLWAEQNGITEGTGSGSFTPLRQCTRAEVITLLFRIYANV